MKVLYKAVMNVMCYAIAYCSGVMTRLDVNFLIVLFILYVPMVVWFKSSEDHI
jgi:hypothetical protein